MFVLCAKKRGFRISGLLSDIPIKFAMNDARIIYVCSFTTTHTYSNHSYARLLHKTYFVPSIILTNTAQLSTS
jgi:hypothetical protein